MTSCFFEMCELLIVMDVKLEWSCSCARWLFIWSSSLWPLVLPPWRKC